MRHLTVIVLLSLVASVYTLTCLKCEDIDCKPPRCKRGVGLVKDPCQCCLICAKTKGEDCGGPWDIFGTCDKRLKCDAEKTNDKGVCIRDKKKKKKKKKKPEYKPNKFVHWPWSYLYKPYQYKSKPKW